MNLFLLSLTFFCGLFNQSLYAQTPKLLSTKEVDSLVYVGEYQQVLTALPEIKKAWFSNMMCGQGMFSASILLEDWQTLCHWGLGKKDSIDSYYFGRFFSDINEYDHTRFMFQFYRDSVLNLSNDKARLLINLNTAIDSAKIQKGNYGLCVNLRFEGEEINLSENSLQEIYWTGACIMRYSSSKPADWSIQQVRQVLRFTPYYRFLAEMESVFPQY